jgi:hypothetical protein
MRLGVQGPSEYPCTREPPRIYQPATGRRTIPPCVDFLTFVTIVVCCALLPFALRLFR